MKSKKILFTQTDNIELMVENGAPLGGAVVETMVWMKAMHALGFQILQLRQEGDQRKILPGFEWVTMVPTYNSKKGIRWFKWLYYRIPKIIGSLKQSNTDYVYESIPSWVSFFTVKICYIFKIRLILRIANDYILDERIYRTHSKFEKKLVYKALSQCDYILPQNKYQYDQILKFFPGKKVLMLPNPFVLENRELLKTKQMGNGYIAWVANFRYQKNLKLLYEICLILDTQKVKIAGRYERVPGEETYKYVEKLKNLPNVEFVGTVSRNEILDFFSKASFLLNTSRYEGFSNTFLEAMATGTPILTTAAVNPDGIIDRFALGYVYESPENLQEILRQVSSDEYEQKSSNCIEYLKAHHDHLIIGQKLKKFIE
jgi:glycosyltransferase involved in cell wall biosynthesis